MPQDEPLEIQNLLLAAVLLVGGAKLLSVKSEGRLSTLVMSMGTYESARLSEPLTRLASEISDVECTAEAWAWAFDSSVLGSVEAEYRRLKRLVVKQRQR